MPLKLAVLCLFLTLGADCFGQQNFLPSLSNRFKLVEDFTPLQKDTVKKSIPKKLAVQENASCAHIVMVPAPQHLDPKMIVQVPKTASRMPIHKGLPACSEDLR